jgi:DNA-binding MarR family transcriptional regulator
MNGQRAAAKYAAFEGKRYLRMLVTTAKCPLTHSERLVLSYRVYKARDVRPLSNTKIARVLGLDRHTVSNAVKSLDSQGVYVDDPVPAKPEWFAKPHRDGTPRCYRHYLVERGLTKLENTLYWMMWSLTKDRTVVQSKSGLAALTNYSRYRVIGAINKLVTKGLIKVNGKKIMLLDPPTLDYWQDRKQKVAKLVVEAATAPVLSEDWVEVLVEFCYETASRSDKGFLVQMIEKQVSLMKNAHMTLADIQEYWQMVLRLIPDVDKAWNFACFKFEDLLKDALQIHCEKGGAKTCIALLSHLTKQQLRQTPAILW